MHLEEPLVREASILFHGSSVQHANLARLRELLELVEQPRLADAGLAADEHELPLAGDRRVQPLLQLRRLALAPDERRHRRPAATAAFA